MNRLPAGWVECSLSDVCELVEKVDPTATPDKEIHYIDIGSVESGSGRLLGAQVLAGKAAPSRARQLVAAGDVLFSTVRTYMMKTTAVPPDLNGAVASTGFCVLRPNPSVNPSLVLHAVRQPEFVERISSAQTGSSYPAVRDRDVRAMPIRLPPLPEQGRIVAAIEEAFSLLDAGETALHNTRTRLKRMRDAVLTAALTGRLVPQDPTDTPAEILLADLGAESIKDLPGQLPESWCWVLLGEASSIAGGIQKQPKRRPARNPVPFLRVANVGRGSLDLTEVHDIEVFEGELDRYGLRAGDLLVVEGNGSPDQIGRAAVWGGQIAPCVHQNHLIRVRPGQAVNPGYLGVYWNSPDAAARVQAVASSTSGLHTLSTGKLKRLPVAVPPIEEQGRIVAEVERQFSFIEAAERAVETGLRRSAGLRRSVLKAAFEGRLVAQDPGDEPASVLLERIAAERAAAAPRTRRAPRRVRGEAK